jgi:hypothetical protein
MDNPFIPFIIRHLSLQNNAKTTYFFHNELLYLLGIGAANQTTNVEQQGGSG